MCFPAADVTVEHEIATGGQELETGQLVASIVGGEFGRRCWCCSRRDGIRDPREKQLSVHYRVPSGDLSKKSAPKTTSPEDLVAVVAEEIAAFAASTARDCVY